MKVFPLTHFNSISLEFPKMAINWELIAIGGARAIPHNIYPKIADLAKSNIFFVLLGLKQIYVLRFIISCWWFLIARGDITFDGRKNDFPKVNAKNV